MSHIIKTEGIVFKSLKYSETSLILDIYTKENGLQSFIVGGVRKAKSKIANVYHPMNIIDLIAYDNSNGLSRIKEAQYHYKYESLFLNVVKSAIGMYIIDISRNAIREKEVNYEVYDLIKTYMISIDKNMFSIKTIALYYTINLAAYLGFQMHNNYSENNNYFDLSSGQFVTDDGSNPNVLNVELSFKLHQLLADNSELTMTRDEKNELLDHLIRYYQIHVNGFKELKSLPVLRTILS